jgi:hypothetical protein
MKVVCVNNIYGYWLTIGKIYSVQEGQLRGGSIQQWRDKQLDKVI